MKKLAWGGTLMSVKARKGQNSTVAEAGSSQPRRGGTH